MDHLRDLPLRVRLDAGEIQGPAQDSQIISPSLSPQPSSSSHLPTSTQLIYLPRTSRPVLNFLLFRASTLVNSVPQQDLTEIALLLDFVGSTARNLVSIIVSI
jgi:hypothetical protein